MHWKTISLSSIKFERISLNLEILVFSVLENTFKNFFEQNNQQNLKFFYFIKSIGDALNVWGVNYVCE